MNSTLKFRIFALLPVAVSASGALAGQTFQNGQLTINSGSVLKLFDANKKEYDLQPGSINLTIADKPVFRGSGTLTLETANGTVVIQIPKKSYTGTVNFMAAAADQSTKLTLIGTYSESSTATDPTISNEDCTFNAVNLTSTTSIVTGQDGQGQDISKNFDVTVPVCIWATEKANTKSIVKVSPSGACQGSRLEKTQQVTTTDHYVLNFYDPSDTQHPVAVYTASQAPITRTADLGSVNSCD